MTITSQILHDRATILVPEELQRELMALQCIQSMLLGLLYDQRKYQRHCPDLGLAVWYGRALLQLEQTETQIDLVQDKIKSFMKIQDN